MRSRIGLSEIGNPIVYPSLGGTENRTIAVQIKGQNYSSAAWALRKEALTWATRLRR